MGFQKQEKNRFNLKRKGEKLIQKEKFRSKMTSKEKKSTDGIDYASRKITRKTTGHKPDKSELKRTWFVGNSKSQIPNSKQISIKKRILYHDSDA